jgi:isoleucyl-tRNA synthetase
MKFVKGQRRRALEYEKDLVLQWKRHKTFEKSVQMRPADNGYVFYDGPPFITNVPHHGNLLASIIKDAVPRYWTMKGKRVERVWGWDCHGLPAEVATEKKLGIQDRRDIGTKFTLEEYVVACRENMVLTGSLWEDTIDRIGRWVDFKGAYKTMDKPYMESVWWAFKKLYDEGKIYEGEKVLLYCTRDATPLSKAEIAMDNSYKDVTEPSVYVKFKLNRKQYFEKIEQPESLTYNGDDETAKLQEEERQAKYKESIEADKNKDHDIFLLAWTTTPWTLPANTATAVRDDLEYAEIELEDGTRLILAETRLKDVIKVDKQPIPFKLVRNIHGSRLVGLNYEPLFENRGQNAHKIWNANYVSEEEGTGVVHLAPAFGEEDYELSKKQGFPFVNNVDDDGFFTDGEWKGQHVWETNKLIAKTLHERGVVWKIEYITHSYPHCYRCGTKLMYRAHPSWFMDIEGQRELMLEQNRDINWFPPHIKKGRFAKTVQSAPDWNLSRDRYWATAMPVWKGKDKHGKEHIKVVGSYAELKELSGKELNDYHRPWIDEVEFTLDGVHYKRIEKVLDCWFESGSMPFAQFHYPFENVEKFEANFPGDFIVEYVGQVRAWFYYMHAVSVGLFGKNSFKNVVVTGTLAGNDGRKMSKSLGNYTDPNELMDKYSADALRFLLTGSTIMAGEDYALLDKDVADVSRKLSMVWNMYDFFTLYAEVDGWEWDGSYDDPLENLSNPLDIWIVSRLHQLIAEVEKHMDGYDMPNAVKPILPFVDDASNWFVRRSRRRFWKSEDDSDKQDAYKTLHYVLVQLAHVMAPFTPFMAEELYQKLTGDESVHLRDWPKSGQVNELLVTEMATARDVITNGLAARASNSLKVRQPLADLTYYAADQLQPVLEDIVAEEINVKKVAFKKADKTNLAHTVALNTKLSPELKREGLVREVIRNVQESRKKAGLNVDDHIKLSLSTTSQELRKAITEHLQTIATEALASQVVFDQTFAYEASCAVEGEPLTVSLAKTK